MELLILFSGSSIFKSTGLCGCTSLWLLLDMFMWGQGREGRNVIKKKMLITKSQRSHAPGFLISTGP